MLRCCSYWKEVVVGLERGFERLVGLEIGGVGIMLVEVVERIQVL
jgi:hypothetical protein